MLSWVYHSENLFWYQSWVELNQRPSFGSPHCWIYQEYLELVDGPDPRAAEELRGSKLVEVWGQQLGWEVFCFSNCLCFSFSENTYDIFGRGII